MKRFAIALLLISVPAFWEGCFGQDDSGGSSSGDQNQSPSPSSWSPSSSPSPSSGGSSPSPSSTPSSPSPSPSSYSPSPASSPSPSSSPSSSPESSSSSGPSPPAEESSPAPSGPSPPASPSGEGGSGSGSGPAAPGGDTSIEANAYSSAVQSATYTGRGQDLGFFGNTSKFSHPPTPPLGVSPPGTRGPGITEPDLVEPNLPHLMPTAAGTTGAGRPARHRSSPPRAGPVTGPALPPRPPGFAVSQRPVSPPLKANQTLENPFLLAAGSKNAISAGSPGAPAIFTAAQLPVSGSPTSARGAVRANTTAPPCANGQRPFCRFYARDMMCCGGGIGLTTDRPAVEVWLLCSEAITLPTECLTVSFTGARKVRATYFPVFNQDTASNFRFLVNHINNTAVYADTDDGVLDAAVLLDLEASRGSLKQCALPLAVPCALSGAFVATAAPVNPISWVSTALPASSAILDDGGAFSADARVPVANFAWQTDAFLGAKGASVCEEEQLWDLPPSFFAAGWQNYRGHQRPCADSSGADGGYTDSSGGVAPAPAPAAPAAPAEVPAAPVNPPPVN